MPLGMGRVQVLLFSVDGNVSLLEHKRIMVDDLLISVSVAQSPGSVVSEIKPPWSILKKLSVDLSTFVQSPPLQRAR